MLLNLLRHYVLNRSGSVLARFLRVVGRGPVRTVLRVFVGALTTCERLVFVSVARLWLALPHTALKSRLNEVALACLHALPIREVPLELLIRRGDVVVQVGAAPDGQVPTMARLVGRRGHVVAIEPDPENLRLLEKTIRARSLRNVTLVARGAWKEKGRQTWLSGPTSQSNIVGMDGAEWTEPFTEGRYEAGGDIEVDTVDNILEEIGLLKKVTFVKATVNGRELEVVQGMPRTLESHPRLWVKGHRVRNGQPINVAIASILREKGYRITISRRGVVYGRWKKSVPRGGE